MITRLLGKIRYYVSIRERIKLERETRLGNAGMNDVLPITTNLQLQKIRNIGIIAHIDAGKTTSTQRMLYYAGALPSPGQIDEGNTTMDYMPQQRQRGITIRSAAISFNWNKHQINLIDTPGHVDFSAQVIRSLQVLDGAVTILDAVKGVQAQTVKVWQQANKRKLPKICFLNKMDRIGSSILRSAQSIKEKLKTEPVLMQMPIGDGDTFKGIVDLVTLQRINFNGLYGQDIQYIPITKKDPKYDYYNNYRQTLIQKIGNFDQQIGDLYLSDKPVGPNQLKLAIRRIMTGTTNVNSICPIFLGSAYKNKGLQPLLDAIIDYFPSPSQKLPVHNVNDPNEFRKPLSSEKLTGFVFKTIYDLQKGLLAYTRIYSGLLSKSMQLMNANSNTPEKIAQIYRVRANQYVTINQAGSGDIVAISGLTSTRAGHTLLSLKDSNFKLETMQMPSPVFVAPFQVQSSKYVRNFEQAMNKIIVQDNSISWNFEKETSQFLVSGLGELHLQIIQDKLIEEGIPVKMGYLKINYKESIKGSITKKHKINRKLKHSEEQFQIQVQIVPLLTEDQNLATNNKVILAFENQSQLFEEYWRQYQLRKTGQIKSRSKQSYDTVQQIQKSKDVAVSKISKKFLRNPNPVQPIHQQQPDNEDNQEELQNMEDQQSEDDDMVQSNSKDDEQFYHISTLPFETLYELVQNCKVSLLYGKYNLPLMGVQVRITNGKYRKEAFTKPVMNQCAQKAIRQCLEQTCVLLQPVMEVDLKGQSEMIQILVKQIIKKRGRVEEREQNDLKCFVPADGVRGWVKQLRSMGFQVSMKLSGYEQVQGINPSKLLEDNN